MFRILLIAIILGSLLLISSSCGSNEIEYKTYTDNSGMFTVEYPDNLSEQSDANSDYIVSTWFKNMEDEVGININAFRVDKSGVDRHDLVFGNLVLSPAFGSSFIDPVSLVRGRLEGFILTFKDSGYVLDCEYGIPVSNLNITADSARLLKSKDDMVVEIMSFANIDKTNGNMYYYILCLICRNSNYDSCKQYFDRFLNSLTFSDSIGLVGDNELIPLL